MLALLLFFLLGLFPDILKKVLLKILKFISRFSKSIRLKQSKISEDIEFVINEFRLSFRYFTFKKPGIIILVFFITIIQMFIFMLIAPSISFALNLPINFNFIVQAITLQIILLFTVYFAPTPGASIFVEGGFTLIFLKLISPSLIGVLVIIWRIITNTIPVLIGSIFAVKSFGIKNVKSVLEETLEKEKEILK
jgi:uncharacterized protein (TIRG00374 family)